MSEWVFAFICQAIFGMAMFLQGYFWGWSRVRPNYKDRERRR